MNLEADTYVPVTSSSIQSASYDADSGTLVITFTSGTRYRYSGVPQSTFEGLKNAASAGTYFARNIRNSYFGTKV